jgi:hypothetical protein
LLVDSVFRNPVIIAMLSRSFETLMWSPASRNPASGIDAAAICKARGFTVGRALEIDFATLRISRVGILSCPERDAADEIAS